MNELQAAWPANQPTCPLFPYFYSLPHALHPGVIHVKEGIKFCHLATLPSGVTPCPQRIQLRKMTLETQDLHSGGCLLPAERADQDTVPAGGRRGRSLPRELRGFPGGGWTARATGRSARGPGDATPSLRLLGIRQESENELSSHLQWGLFISYTLQVMPSTPNGPSDGIRW